MNGSAGYRPFGLPRRSWLKLAVAAGGIALVVAGAFGLIGAHVGLGFAKDLSGKESSVSNPIVAGDHIGYFINRHTEGPQEPVRDGFTRTVWVEPDRFVVRPLDGGSERVVLRFPEAVFTLEDAAEVERGMGLLFATGRHAGEGFVLAGNRSYVDMAQGRLMAGPWSTDEKPVLAAGCHAVTAKQGDPDRNPVRTTYHVYDLCDGGTELAPFVAPGLPDGGISGTLVAAAPGYRIYLDASSTLSIERISDGRLDRLGPYQDGRLLIDTAGEWLVVATTRPGTASIATVRLSDAATAWQGSVDLPQATQIQEVRTDGRHWTAVFNGGAPIENPEAARAGFLYGSMESGIRLRHAVAERGFFESSVPTAIPHQDAVYYVKDVVLYQATPGQVPALAAPAVILGLGLFVAAAVVHRMDGRPSASREGPRCPGCKALVDPTLPFCGGCGADAGGPPRGKA